MQTHFLSQKKINKKKKQLIN